jgi:hypothetical protein
MYLNTQKTLRNIKFGTMGPSVQGLTSTGALGSTGPLPAHTPAPPPASKPISNVQGLLNRLWNERKLLPSYVSNLRYRAKRARIKVNLEAAVYGFKDMIASRYGPLQLFSA